MHVDDIDWAVISLERTPERLVEFQRANGNCGVPAEIFRAVDGRGVDRADLIRSGLVSRDADIWSAGAIGSALSHRELWLRAMRSRRPAGVFEDDVVLRADFVPRAMQLMETLPPDWDLVLLGYNTDSILDVSIAPGLDLRGGFSVPSPSKADCERFANHSVPVSALGLNNAFATCAYFISPKGARVFLDSCFPLRVEHIFVPALDYVVTATTIDALMNGSLRDTRSYACVPPLVLPINDKTTSTIGPTS